MSWDQRAEQLLKDGKSVHEAGKIIHIEYFPEEAQARIIERVRGYVRRRNERIGRASTSDAPDTVEHIVLNKNPDGSVLSDRLIKIALADMKNPDSVMLAHGFDPSEWEMVSCRNNLWSMNSADEEKVNCQSKITVKPSVVSKIAFDVEEYFKNKDFNIEKPKTVPRQYEEDGEYLEVCLPDLHGGLFSWRTETGEDYDLHIARERFEIAMEDIKTRCTGRKFSKILFVTLGDLLNFDNEEQSTTKGTRQQSDGRTAKVHDLVLDMLIDAITMLGNIAPVEVIYLPGNHDLITGRMLMVAVKMAFRNDKNIHFDVSPNPLKARRFGNVMVGWTHGDMPEKNMGSWLPQMARSDFGECSVVEVHAGHFHKQNTKEKSVTVRNYNQTFEDNGVVVRYLPTISSASGWAHQQGYSKTVKTIMSFLWNERTGLRDIWFSGVEQ